MKKIILIFLLIITLSGCEFTANNTTAPTLIEENINLNDIQNHLSDVISYLDSATVVIFNEQYVEGELKTVSQGSGVIYKRIDNVNNTYTYYVITNEHVTDGGEGYSLYDGGGASSAGELVGEDKDSDLAILKFTSLTKYNAVSFGDENILKKGQIVIAMGTPIDTDLYNTATMGIISGFRDELIQHDAAINAGNSGGPLVNINGQLIGINVSKLSNNSEGAVSIEGIGFAINIKKVKQIVFNLEALDTTVARPILGITVTNVSNIIDALAYTRENYITLGGSGDTYDNYLNLKTHMDDSVISGIIVIAITENYPGANAGLRVYDVITGIDGNNVAILTEFQVAVWSKGIGGSATLQINRDGELLNLNINF